MVWTRSRRKKKEKGIRDVNEMMKWENTTEMKMKNEATIWLKNKDKKMWKKLSVGMRT